MMFYGLLGRKLSHSYSPLIHEKLGSVPYNLIEVEPDQLTAFMTRKNFGGINVTMPYKKDVIKYCEGLTETAKILGAVNTIVRRKDGTLLGHNTDYYGFLSLVRRSRIQVEGKKVLVLGNGGASVTVQAVLRTLGARVTVISRSGKNNYINLHLHTDADVIVNATPVGMYPNVGKSPVDLNRFSKLSGVLDLIYNPARTQLIMDAENHNVPAMNGLWMLVAQAKESAQYFMGHFIDDSVVDIIYKGLKAQTENIVLIGMPGCGKTTIGKKLAELTGREFWDSDWEIEKSMNLSVPQVFQTLGERKFREEEQSVLSELGKKSGCIIATGGGCVTNEHNYPLLHQNSCIIWIKRDLNMLACDGRPLSLSGNLKNLYMQREAKYQQFSDKEVDNNSTIQNAVQHILDLEEYL